MLALVSRVLAIATSLLQILSPCNTCLLQILAFTTPSICNNFALPHLAMPSLLQHLPFATPSFGW